MGIRSITAIGAASLLALPAANAAISANTASITLVANGSTQVVSNTTVSLGDGRFAHTGSWTTNNGMMVMWQNLITSYAASNGSELAYISGGFTVKNNSSSTPLVIDLGVFMAGSMAGPATYSGSAGGQGVNFSFSPGALGATSGAPVWSGFINDTLAGGVITSSQNVNPFSLASFAPQSFSGSSSAVSTGLGMRLRLTVAAGIESSFSGAFSVSAVPAPGAVVLAGVAGLLGGRRRR